MKPDALDALAVGVEAFEPPARRVDHRFSRLENAAGEEEGQPADGVDLIVLGGEARVDRFA